MPTADTSRSPTILPSVTDRDQRLVPRLLGVLDTIESDAEIIAAVRNLRRIRGTGFFTGLANPTPSPVYLRDLPIDVARKLHSFAAVLRRIATKEAEPLVAASLQRFVLALEGAGPFEAADLAFALAVIHDGMRAVSERLRDAETALDARRRAQDGAPHNQFTVHAGDLSGLNIQELRQVMGVMQGMTAGGLPRGK